jgi:hypothetical protein
MNGIDTLVPAFNRSLDALPGAQEAWRQLEGSLAGPSFLPARSAAIIALVVAERVGDEYARWAMHRLAERAGVNGEARLLAASGTSLDPCMRAVVKAAWIMVSVDRLSQGLECPAPHAMLLGERGAAELTAYVAMTLLACRVLQSVAPKVTAAAR